jgi:group I intron endonuclease
MCLSSPLINHWRMEIWPKIPELHSFRKVSQMKSGIYQILNIINNKFYIGSAIDFNRRLFNHNTKLNNNIHDNPKLQAAWNKYGADAFIFQIIEYCEKDKLLEREQLWMDWLKPDYNILKIAGSSIGYKHTDEFRALRSWLYTGRKQSRETIEKRAASMRGKQKSQEHRDKIKKAKQFISKETREKIGLKHKGKTISEEHRKSVSKAASLLQIKRKEDKLKLLKLSLENEIKW